MLSRNFGTSHLETFTGDGSEVKFIDMEGHDVINDGAGSDFLDGGDGDDTLIGGVGKTS
jgi:Ca2+-binding RTX toxin-like protein